MPSLGEILAANGRTFSVLASNPAGARRLLNHKARKLGQVTLSGHFPCIATSAEMLRQVETLLAPTPAAPPAGNPDLASQAFLTSAFLDVIWSQIRPDVQSSTSAAGLVYLFNRTRYVLSIIDKDLCEGTTGHRCPSRKAQKIEHCRRNVANV